LFPVVNVLTCVIEVILFSTVAVKTQTFHKLVHVTTRTLEVYGGIFGDSIIKNVYPYSESEISL